MPMGDVYTGEQSWGAAAKAKPPSTGVMRAPTLGGSFRNDFNHMPGAATYAQAGPAPTPHRDAGVPGTGTGPVAPTTSSLAPRDGGAAGTGTGSPYPTNGSIADVLYGQLLGVQGQYQWGADMATADNALNQQMLGLKQAGLGIDAQGINTDKQSVQIKKGATETDSQFLKRQREMYDSQLANQLAGIDTKLGVQRLDHENQYISGGSWFAPGQKFRKDAMNATAEQDKLDARLGTAMSQLGVDRTLAGNQAQMQEYDLDMNRLDQRLAQNGINLQMLGLNGQQLTLALQKHLGDLGISSVIDAQKLLTEAATGQGDAADYAQQLLTEWLQSGGQGNIGPVGMGG